MSAWTSSDVCAFSLPENREENVYGRVHYECEQCRQWIRMGCPHAGTAGRYRYPDDDPDEIFPVIPSGTLVQKYGGGIFHDKHVTKHTEAGDQSISQFQSALPHWLPPSAPVISSVWQVPWSPAVPVPSSGCGLLLLA